jgi:hypothetical protein
MFNFYIKYFNINEQKQELRNNSSFRFEELQ